MMIETGPLVAWATTLAVLRPEPILAEFRRTIAGYGLIVPSLPAMELLCSMLAELGQIEWRGGRNRGWRWTTTRGERLLDDIGGVSEHCSALLTDSQSELAVELFVPSEDDLLAGLGHMYRVWSTGSEQVTTQVFNVPMMRDELRRAILADETLPNQRLPDDSVLVAGLDRLCPRSTIWRTEGALVWYMPLDIHRGPTLFDDSMLARLNEVLPLRRAGLKQREIAAQWGITKGGVWYLEKVARRSGFGALAQPPR